MQDLYFEIQEQEIDCVPAGTRQSKLNVKLPLKTYYNGFSAYLMPKANPILTMYKFHEKMQENGESFKHFVRELKLLVVAIQILKKRPGTVKCLLPSVPENLLSYRLELRPTPTS